MTGESKALPVLEGFLVGRATFLSADSLAAGMEFSGVTEGEEKTGWAGSLARGFCPAASIA